MQFNKFGFYKYNEHCRKQHVNETCEKQSCEVLSCILRHPKECRYFQDFNRCKFSEWCRFKHSKKDGESDWEKLRNENKDIKCKLERMEEQFKDIHTMDDIIHNLNQKFIEMEENMKVKDDLINDLVLRIKVVEQKQNSSEEEAEKENLDVEKRSECETSVSERKTNDSASDIQDEKVFECDICTYKTKSENGIKIHKAKKHTNTCKCCNRTFTDQVDYSNHITECYSTYSYYDSPISPVHRIPPRFPPRFPHGSPPRFPPTYPPRFPRSPLY